MSGAIEWSNGDSWAKLPPCKGYCCISGVYIIVTIDTYWNYYLAKDVIVVNFKHILLLLLVGMYRCLHAHGCMCVYVDKK